jgi:hypothetical protein
VSTQINVTVGSGGLSDKARQLQTAARQAQLEKERQQRLEAEGTEQRNAKLEAEGKAPDGSPLYGARFNQPEIERRPAANRQGYGALLTGPFVYSNYGGSNTGLTIRCRGNRNVVGSRFSYEQNTAYPEGAVVAGPTENTQTLEATDTLGSVTTVSYSGQDQATGDIITWSEQWASEAVYPSLKCAYAVQNGLYDTVLNWQNESASVIPAPPYNVVDLSGNLVPVSGFRPLTATKSFTHEFIVRMPTTTMEDGSGRLYGFTVDSLARVVSTSCKILISFAGLTITVSTGELYQAISSIILLFTEGPAGTPIGETRLVPRSDRSSNYYAECLIRNPNFTASDGQPLNGRTARPGFNNVGAFALPDAIPSTFVHFALTRYPVDSAYRWAMFANGVRLMDNITEPTNWDTTYGAQPPSVDVVIENRGSKFGRSTLPSMGIHGARFTPKVLYTDNFTPPTTLIGFS